MQCGIFLLLTSFLGCTSCYKDIFIVMWNMKESCSEFHFLWLKLKSKSKFGLIICSCFNVQCGIFLLLTSFLGCTSCYKDTFAQLHRKKGREFMFICRHIVETIPRLVRGCFQAVCKDIRTLGWSKSPVVKPTLTVAVYTCILVSAVSMA